MFLVARIDPSLVGSRVIELGWVNGEVVGVRFHSFSFSLASLLNRKKFYHCNRNSVGII